jgi:hypothetical protein
MTTNTRPRPVTQPEAVGEWESQPTAPTAPTSPGQWSISRIEEALSRPLPENMLSSKKMGGQTIKYVAWPVVSRILNKYAPGWEWSVTLTVSQDRLFVVGKLSIPTSDGLVSREATGTEALKEERPIMIVEEGKRIPLVDDLGRTVYEPKEIAFGDSSSNAESMAFRRAAARFGLALYMYDKK